MLALNNVEVVYDGVILVLRGVSLNAEEGRITTLLGANDAGQVELGRYSVSNGVLHIHDEAGKNIGASYRLRDGDDPRQTAVRLAREAWRKSRGESDFNRPLHYQGGSFA